MKDFVVVKVDVSHLPDRKRNDALEKVFHNMRKILKDDEFIIVDHNVDVYKLSTNTNNIDSKGVIVYDDHIVTYNNDKETKNKVFNRIVEYMKNYNATLGEIIHQSDDCVIESPNVLSDIVDNILETKIKEIE